MRRGPRNPSDRGDVCPCVSMTPSRNHWGETEPDKTEFPGDKRLSGLYTDSKVEMHGHFLGVRGLTVSRADTLYMGCEPSTINNRREC